MTKRMLQILDNVRYWDTCPDDYKRDIESFLEKQNRLDIVNIGDDDLRFRAEEDKSLIYDSKTDKDICTYFDNTTKDWLITLLNKYDVVERSK